MKTLSFREKAGYSCGEFGGSGLWQIMMIFLPIFYTDVFGIAPSVAATLFLVVRLSDAVTDPVVGILADRTKTRWGNFRPWILGSAAPFGLMAFALFFAPPLGETGRVVYAYATYILMMVIYTSAQIPLSALSGVMTSDHIERTSINAYRFIFAFGAAFIVQTGVKPAVSFFGGGDDVLGYRVTIAIFAVIAILMYLVVFFSTRERVKPETTEKTPILRDLADLMKNRPWLIVLSVSLVTLIYVSIRSAAQTYYFKYYLGVEDLVSVFMGLGTLCIILGIFVTKPLSRIFGKRKLFIYCSIAMGVTNMAFYWVGPEDRVLLFALQILTSFATGPTMPLLWSMMADAADYSEWKNHRRATGLVFSASTFAQKAGGAVGGAVAMLVLAMYGYQANVEQTPEVLAGMKHMMSTYPAAGSFLCVLILWFYPLEQSDLDEIERDLAARKGKNPEE